VSDPLEGTNLAGDPAHALELRRVRALLSAWMRRTGDDPIAELARETPPANNRWPGGWFGPGRSPAPNSRDSDARSGERSRALPSAPTGGTADPTGRPGR
jgi:hypothetical protein